MRKHFSRWTVHVAAVLGLSFAGAGSAFAQATAAATRAAEVSAFGMTSVVAPDYGPTRNYGYTFGVDYSQLDRGLFNTSLEARYTSTPGKTVDENVFFGGLRLHGAPLFNTHPYITILGGSGTITFVHPNPGYPKDFSFVLGLGAGADIPLRRNLSLKADFLHQTWYYTPHHLTPVGISIGVRYTILGGGLGGIR